MAAVNRLDPGPDAVLISGDLANTPAAGEYELLRDLVEPLGAPLHVLTGNHDDPALLREHFPLEGSAEGDYRYVAEIGDLRLVAVDSTVEGSDAGAFGPERLAWLESLLDEAVDQPTIVAVHHPPVDIGIEALDEIRIAEPDAAQLIASLASRPQVLRVICGHVHRAAVADLAPLFRVHLPEQPHGGTARDRRRRFALGSRARGGAARLCSACAPGGRGAGNARPASRMTLTPAEANRRFYAEHAQDYDATELCVNAERARHRLEVILDRATTGLSADARILDAGGGSGNASLLLSDRGFSPLLLDVSPEMVAIWEQKARDRGFEPRSQISTLEKFFASDERSWDLIVFSSVLHHLESPVALLEAAAARLAPGGFIATVFDPLELSGPGLRLRRLDYLAWVLAETPGRVPELVTRRLRRLPPEAPEEVNLGAIAEYHAESGLRDTEIIDALTKAGLGVVVHDRIYDGRFAFSRRLARMARMPTAFSLVVRSPASPG